MELIDSAIQHGSFHRFGKNMLRVSKKSGWGTLILVCVEVSETLVKVITIEWGEIAYV